MPLEVVNQDSVLERALVLMKQAQARVWITSPWIRGRAVNLLLRDVLPRAASGDIEVKIIYRIKEPTDLEITDYEALKTLEDSGCEIRYSTRLHAKLLLVDDSHAIVSSSNLTEAAGYSPYRDPATRNEELGIAVEGEAELLEDLEAQFRTIWDAAGSVDAELLGISMDFPVVNEFRFVAIREVRQGQFVMTEAPDGSIVLGRITGITSYNRSFPRMNQAMWITQGYTGGPEHRGPLEIPDLQSLFSHPTKERGFLVTKTFFEPESVFEIAQVEVLKHVSNDRLIAPTVPVAPGADVRNADPKLLTRLLGDGDLTVGRVLHHHEVPVPLRGEEILTKHMAVLGMTGSGKSNAVFVLLREFLRAYEDERVVVIDLHGEYVERAAELAPTSRVVVVEKRECIQFETTLRDLARGVRWSNDLPVTVAELTEALPEPATLADLLDALEVRSEEESGSLASLLGRVAQRARTRADVCLLPEEAGRIIDSSGAPETLDDPGLYILDLRDTLSLAERSVRTGLLLDHVFKRAANEPAGYRALVVVDEAQNLAPERTTGQMTEARESADAMFRIASEGRKFGIGLVVSTQRPARISKDVLSQCNTHMIFRVANVEDLGAIAGSFEAASRQLIEELPGFDTGTCIIGGTAIGMVTRVEVPLFA